MPIDVPDGQRRGEIANVLAFRSRTGATAVTVTWPVEDQVNLLKADFEYHSPRAALDAGCKLGEKYEEDAKYMEKMVAMYG